MILETKRNPSRGQCLGLLVIVTGFLIHKITNILIHSDHGQCYALQIKQSSEKIFLRVV